MKYNKKMLIDAINFNIKELDEKTNKTYWNKESIKDHVDALSQLIKELKEGENK